MLKVYARKALVREYYLALQALLEGSGRLPLMAKEIVLMLVLGYSELLV